MKDCRRTLLDEFVKLSKDWDNNNMLYNSLMFSKLYPGDVENSVADASLMPKQSDEKMRNDIMTSWWTPTKIFLLGNKKELMQKSRKELEEVLLERIPMGKDEEQLRESLSKIRHEKTGEKIEKDVIDAFMGFLGSVYAVGNMTSAAVTSRGGALDNWDAKLKNIHEKYIKEEITGFEEISGIPGTIGGAILMNAGAHGKEMKDIVTEITAIDYEGKIHKFTNKEAEFTYRHSKFSDGKYIILQAKLELEKGNTEEIKAKMDEYAQFRKEKQPIEYPSAGSTFKRGKDFITAKLIDEAGLKGYSVGGAMVSKKHAFFSPCIALATVL